MAFAPFLATRYLKPKRTFVSIITVISILGVALGVWLLAVVIAVYTGYGERIKESILGFEPHLVIDSGGFLKNWPEPYEQIEEFEGVVSATPFVSGQVVMLFEESRGAPVIRGILPPEGVELERMRGKLATQPDPDDPEDKARALPRGDFDLNDPDSAVIGSGIAEAQNLTVGDKILLYSPHYLDEIMKSLERVEGAADAESRKKGIEEIREMRATQEITVTGIFDSGHRDFDENIVFVHLATAQILYSFSPEECHGIAVRTDDAFKANDYQAKLHDILPEQFRVLTWGQMHQGTLDNIAAELQAMYLILFMVIIVSGFCIMNTMITVTFQKRSEIGLIKALGATEEQVASVFLFQGVLVGLVGVVIGLLLAQATLYIRNDIATWVGGTFGVGFFTQEVFKVDGGLPAKQSMRDLVIISTGAFFACTIASIVPALIAAFLQPAKALRTQ